MTLQMRLMQKLADESINAMWRRFAGVEAFDMSGCHKILEEDIALQKGQSAEPCVSLKEATLEIDAKG